MVRIAAIVAASLVAAAAAVPAGAADSQWAAKANAACRQSNAKLIAAFGGHSTVPTTPSGMFTFMVKIRPLEVGRLAPLRAIPAPPSGASKAFALARGDIAEIDTAVAAYRAGNSVAFGRDAVRWWNDNRTGRAFAALGAKACT